MKVIRRNENPATPESRPGQAREVYYFYERNTGVTHFHVDAAADGSFPIDQAAGLLAMHCMVRGQAPSDYVVMIQADDELMRGLNERAVKLLQAGHSVGASAVRLTRREEEVLNGVMRSLSNKEIAAGLNLSERTVKFHVSSLLVKFRVRGRMELVQEASKQCAGSSAVSSNYGTREARAFVAGPQPLAPAVRTPSLIAMNKRPISA